MIKSYCSGMSPLTINDRSHPKVNTHSVFLQQKKPFALKKIERHLTTPVQQKQWLQENHSTHTRDKRNNHSTFFRVINSLERTGAISQDTNYFCYFAFIAKGVPRYGTPFSLFCTPKRDFLSKTKKEVTTIILIFALTYSIRTHFLYRTDLFLLMSSYYEHSKKTTQSTI